MSKRLYVYAITDAPIQVDDVPGLACETLSLVDGPSCWLTVGWIAEPPQATVGPLTAQDAVVRTLATRAEALLPLRFGTSFEDERALRASLERFEADGIRSALARVHGCEQMILRVFRSGPATAVTRDAAMGPGTAYLTQRAAAMQVMPASLLESLRSELRSIAREEIAEAAQHAPMIGSVYHLIPRGAAARYHAIVSAWAAPPDITLHVSGPSPAYAFAKDALS
jgi:hypothetical protein